MHDKKGDGHELSGGMQHYHASTVMDVDNFRPTAPGHSPGIGHSLVENYHASADIDVDNFRPTAPGHSPGIGHSQVEHYHTSMANFFQLILTRKLVNYVCHSISKDPS